MSAVGLEARSLVALCDGATGEQPVPSVAYNIVKTHSGYGVRMGVGRGELELVDVFAPADLALVTTVDRQLQHAQLRLGSGLR